MQAQENNVLSKFEKLIGAALALLVVELCMALVAPDHLKWMVGLIQFIPTFIFIGLLIRHRNDLGDSRDSN